MDFQNWQLAISLPLIISVIAIIFFRRYSTTFGLIDNPGHRKIHKDPIPAIGGISIILTNIVTGSILSYYNGIDIFNYFFLIIIFSTLIILLSGIFDDIFGLSFSVKFFSQFLASGILVFCGNYSFELINYPFDSFFTIIFLVGLINSINLIDGIDGLLGGASIIFLFAFLFIFDNSFHLNIMIIPLLLSLLVFLFYNTYPAKIFMGDSGSLALGWVFGLLSIHFTHQSNFMYDFSFPMIILSIPLCDTVFVMFNRFYQNRKLSFKSRFRSMFIGDNNHLHHIILKMSPSPLLATLIMYILISITALTSISAISYNYPKALLFLIIFYFIFRYFLHVHFNKGETLN